MEIQISAAKINKYAVSESGDTLEVVERPGGGLSVVLADGQSSGKSAKRISNLVVRKVISLLAEGVRDGAAARAASDYLFHERRGKVSATLNVLSIDLDTRTLVITRNNPAPVLLAHGDQITVLDDACVPVGIYRDTRPQISQVPLEVGLSVVNFTDGLVHAGQHSGQPMDIRASFAALINQPDISTQGIADALLGQALELDQGRPADDISVVVLRVTPGTGELVRRMSARLPLQS